MKTYIDRKWLPNVRYVFVQWGDDETDIVDDETGVVIYTTPSTPRALVRAIEFALDHSFTIRRVDVLPRRAE
jgi:hypothetical protein